MVPETPAHGFHNRDVLGAIVDRVEVPEGGGSGDDELLEAHEEGHDPEEAEQVIPHRVESLVVEVDICHQAEVRIRSRYDLTHRV